MWQFTPTWHKSRSRKQYLQLSVWMFNFQQNLEKPSDSSCLLWSETWRVKLETFCWCFCWWPALPISPKHQCLTKCEWDSHALIHTRLMTTFSSFSPPGSCKWWRLCIYWSLAPHDFAMAVSSCYSLCYGYLDYISSSHTQVRRIQLLLSVMHADHGTFVSWGVAQIYVCCLESIHVIQVCVLVCASNLTTNTAVHSNLWSFYNHWSFTNSQDYLFPLQTVYSFVIQYPLPISSIFGYLSHLYNPDHSSQRWT